MYCTYGVAAAAEHLHPGWFSLNFKVYSTRRSCWNSSWRRRTVGTETTTIWNCLASEENYPTGVPLRQKERNFVLVEGFPAEQRLLKMTAFWAKPPGEPRDVPSQTKDEQSRKTTYFSHFAAMESGKVIMFPVLSNLLGHWCCRSSTISPAE